MALLYFLLQGDHIKVLSLFITVSFDGLTILKYVTISDGSGMKKVGFEWVMEFPKLLISSMGIQEHNFRWIKKLRALGFYSQYSMKISLFRYGQWVGYGKN